MASTCAYTQLLTSGEDGLVVWDATSATAMRTISHACPSHVSCSRFYALNCALALLGTTKGTVEVLNCSSGTPAGQTHGLHGGM